MTPNHSFSAAALDIWRGERHLCHGLSLRVEAGQAIRLHGANGAGKTTLIRILAGLSQPESGTVCWDDRALAEAGDDYRRELAYLGHVNGLKSNLTPLENLSAHIAMAGLTPAISIPEALTRLGVGDVSNRPCGSLSMGQQRRTALARLLLSDAALWLLDEPLTSLDVAGVGLLEAIVRAHLDAQGIAIFATHQPLDLGKRALQTIVLDPGHMTRGVLPALIHRDLRLAYRRRGEMVTPLMFFIMVTALFPLGLDPEPALLRTLAPGVIWVAALLAGLIGLESLFKSDYEDGALELMVLSPVPLELIALIRVLTHWLITGLPLVILAPLMGMLLSFPASAMDTLLTGLLLGTPVLSLLGAVGAALTVGLRRSGMLLPLLILPLAVPVLIFGARSAAMAVAGDDASGPLYLLGAMLALALTLAPFAIASGLRVSLEN